MWLQRLQMVIVAQSNRYQGEKPLLVGSVERVLQRTAG